MSILPFWKSGSGVHITFIFVLISGIGGVLYSPPVSAIDLSDTAQLHGYASQACLRSDANRFFGKSDRGSFDFREFGINLSWQLLPNLQFAAQESSRKAGDTAKAKPHVDYALVDFTFNSQAENRGGVRIGRYKNAYGLYNLTRDVANTRPSILLPESIYIDASRDIILASDGAQVYSEHRSEAGDFLLDIGAGRLILDKEFREFLKAGMTYMGRVLYERDGGKLRLGLTGADATLESDIPLLPDAEVRVTTYIISAQYNEDRWSVTGEFQPEMKTAVKASAPLFPSRTTTAMNYYLQGTCRLARDWEVLVRYDVQFIDKNDKAGSGHAAATGLPAYSRFAKDWTAGLGWYVTRGFVLRAEGHFVDGTSWLSSNENPDPEATKRRWNLYALQGSYAF